MSLTQATPQPSGVRSPMRRPAPPRPAVVPQAHPRRRGRVVTEPDDPTVPIPVVRRPSEPRAVVVPRRVWAPLAASIVVALLNLVVCSWTGRTMTGLSVLALCLAAAGACAFYVWETEARR